MSTVDDVSSLIGSLGGLSGVVAACGAVGGLIHVLNSRRKKKAAGGTGQSSPEDSPAANGSGHSPSESPSEPRASVLTGSARVAFALAIVAVVLAAVLVSLVGLTSARLTQSSFHDLELGIQGAFFGAIAFAIFSLVGALGSHQEPHAAGAGWRAVASLLAAFLALVATEIVSAS